MDTLANRLGETIRRARQARAQTQEALAESIGVHRTYVGTIERGVNITIEMLERVAGALGVPVSQLITEAEGKANREPLKRVRNAPRGAKRRRE